MIKIKNDGDYDDGIFVKKFNILWQALPELALSPVILRDFTRIPDGDSNPYLSLVFKAPGCYQHFMAFTFEDVHYLIVTHSYIHRQKTAPIGQ